MIWSSRERNKSCSPLSRRSRGRIEPSAPAWPGAENHASRFEGIPFPNLQENRSPHPEFRQNQGPEFSSFDSQINGLGKFHGRLVRALSVQVESESALLLKQWSHF